MDDGCGILPVTEVFDDDKLDRIVGFNSAIMMIAKSTNIGRHGWLKACRPAKNGNYKSQLSLLLPRLLPS